jgi:hypothetical protein
LGIALRIYALSRSGDFSFDEMFSFTFSQRPWLESFKFWTWETNPPLHIFLLKLWFYIVPHNEIWARILSSIFGAVSIYAIYALAKRLFNYHIAIFSALLLAINPMHIWFSFTARGYTLLTLLSILSVYFFHQIFIEEKNSYKTKICFAIISVLLLYTHLTALAIFACQFVIVCFKKKVIQWFKIIICPTIIWFIWLIPSVSSKLIGQAAQDAWYLNIKKDILNYLWQFQLLIFGPADFGLCLFILSAIIIAVIFILYHTRKTNKINLNVINILIFTFLPLITALAIGLFNLKFIWIAVPYLLISLACGLFIIFNFVKIPWFSLIMIIIFILPGTKLLLSSMPFGNWREIDTIIAKYSTNNKKEIFIYNNPIFRDIVNKYVNTSLPKKAMYLSAINNWDEMIIKENYILTKASKEKIDTWVKENEINKFETIFLMYDDRMDGYLPYILKNNGWLLQKSFFLKTNDDQQLKIYVRDEKKY